MALNELIIWLIIHGNRVNSSYLATLHSFVNSNYSKQFPSYFKAMLVVTICTLIGHYLFRYLDHSNLIMLYLLGVVYVATSNNGNQGPSVFAALLSTLAFHFFFIPPFFSFAVSDIQYVFTLIVMLVITQIISHLTVHVQRNIEATQKAQVQAEREQLRNILLTSISHDMRTPLTIIMGSAGTLLQPESITSDQHRELAKNIYDESKRLNNIIINILQMIRLESGTIKIEKKLYPLPDIVSDLTERYSEELRNHPIQLSISKYLPLIPLDHILIEQVFVNLIENAIKYSPPKMPINVTIRMRGKNALVKIADYGKGINPNELEDIFNKFHKSLQPEVTNNGFGLGLAICKHIIEAHSGKIWAENQKKGGAVFYFTLPSME